MRCKSSKFLAKHAQQQAPHLAAPGERPAATGLAGLGCRARLSYALRKDAGNGRELCTAALAGRAFLGASARGGASPPRLPAVPASASASAAAKESANAGYSATRGWYCESVRPPVRRARHRAE
jgi:hypothetical protein